MSPYDFERLFYENQQLLRENKELKESIMSHRKELEATKVNYMVKFGSLENEVNQSISKNNVLKNKIKKIKKFMVSLCKLIEEQQ